MCAAELSDRVVAVAEEDPLVELGGAGALVAIDLGGGFREVLRKLVEEQPAERALVAGVAREQRALDGLREVDEREHGPVEVREVRLKALALLVSELLDRVIHGDRS